MATEENVTLSYNPAQMRVLLKIRCGYCRTSPIPVDIEDRVRKKLENEVVKKRISHYLLYKENLNILWQAVRRSEKTNAPDNMYLEFTYAQCIPETRGMEIEDRQVPESICRLKCSISPEQAKAWRPKSFIAQVGHLMRGKGLHQIPSPAQLMSVYHKILHGMREQTVDLIPSPQMSMFKNEPAKYICRFNKEKGLELVVLDVRPFEDTAKLNALVDSVKRKATEAGFTILEEFLVSELKSALRSEERFGFGLPLVIYAGQDISELKKSEAIDNRSIPKDWEERVPTTYPGKGILTVDVSADKLQASITDFKIAHYENASVPLDDTWYRRELKRLGLMAPRESTFNRVVDSLRRKKELNNLIAVEGIPPVGPKKPVLSNLTKGTSGAGTQNVRESQNMGIVRAESLVAKIMYQTKGSSGRDVFGSIIPMPDPDEVLTVIDGEGIKREGDLFYATHDGVLLIKDNKIEILRTYIHKGDINLATGDVSFSGSVIIDGSIDTGAHVTASGDLTVKGNIRGAFIKCGGNMLVTGGIVTTDKGYVICKGELQADFIENSIVYAFSDLRVKKAMLSSKIFATKSIYMLNESGTVAGCEAYVYECMETGHLGFDAGMETTIYLGSDWRVEQRINLWESRLIKVDAALEKVKLELREIIRVTKKTPTEKNSKLKDDLKEKTDRIRVIAEKVKLRAEAVAQKRPFNEAAYVCVRKTIHTTVKFIIKRRTVDVKKSLSELGVTAVAAGDSHFCPLNKVSRKKVDKAS